MHGECNFFYTGRAYQGIFPVATLY